MSCCRVTTFIRPIFAAHHAIRGVYAPLRDASLLVDARAAMVIQKSIIEAPLDRNLGGRSSGRTPAEYLKSCPPAQDPPSQMN